MKDDELLEAVRDNVRNVTVHLLTEDRSKDVGQKIESQGVKCIYNPWKEIDLINLIKD